MKFGKQLRATVEARMPQWSDNILDYKLLKQTVKRLSLPGTTQPDDAIEEFTSFLSAEVEKVNDFYIDRIEEVVIILHALTQSINQAEATSSVTMEALDNFQRSLLTLHFNLLMLQHYVSLNVTACVKILKKFDKKFQSRLRGEYIPVITEQPFYRCEALGQLVEESEKYFKHLEALRNAPSLVAAAQKLSIS